MATTLVVIISNIVIFIIMIIRTKALSKGSPPFQILRKSWDFVPTSQTPTIGGRGRGQGGAACQNRTEQKCTVYELVRRQFLNTRRVWLMTF